MAIIQRARIHVLDRPGKLLIGTGGVAPVRVAGRELEHGHPVSQGRPMERLAAARACRMLPVLEAAQTHDALLLAADLVAEERAALHQLVALAVAVVVFVVIAVGS